MTQMYQAKSERKLPRLRLPWVAKTMTAVRSFNRKCNPDEGRTTGVTRRELFIGAGGLATSFALAPFVTNAVGEVSAASDTPAESKMDRRMKVIVAGGHPGDPEYGCGGTIARLTNLGHEVVLLYLNDGGWPPTSSATRIAEAKKACELLKARPAYAGQVNGNAVVDNAHYEAYAKMIDAEKPDIMLTQWPIDNHRDHRAITMLTYDAWRQSKRISLFTTTRSQMGRTHCSSLRRTTLTLPKRKQSNVPPATRTPARRLTGTMHCRIRWPLFAGWRAARNERKRLCFNCKARAIHCRPLDSHRAGCDKLGGQGDM
jgi:LmbE family N-acetylglucosaminyl deacetylase